MYFPFLFSFFLPFLLHILFALLLLPPTPLSARLPLFSSLSTYPSSPCSGLILVHVVVTFPPRTCILPLTFYLPTTCLTTRPLPSSLDILPRLTCTSRPSVRIPSSLSRTFFVLPCDSSLPLPIGYPDTLVLGYLHTQSLLIAGLPHATVFPLANRFPSSPFSRLRSDWAFEFPASPQSSIYRVPSCIYLP